VGRVNPLTDLSRSYLICLSQRGVEEARKGERERKRERERERGNYEPAETGERAIGSWKGARTSLRTPVPRPTSKPCSIIYRRERSPPPTFMSLNGRCVLERI